MSDDKKSEQLKTYPVRSVRFMKPMLLPGASGRADLRGDIVQDNMVRWVIEFIPSMRSFRVSHFEANSKQPTVRMVPESAVADWEPLT